MEVLFVTTELFPWVKRSSLADVASALPKALRGLGHRVTLVMPRDQAFDDAGLLLARRLTPIEFDLGAQRYSFTVYDVRLPSQVDLVLIEGAELAAGALDATSILPGLLLSRAAAELARARAAQGQGFDVIHGHGWHAAYVGAYIRELATQEPTLFGALRTVLTLGDADVALDGSPERERGVHRGTVAEARALAGLSDDAANAFVVDGAAPFWSSIRGGAELSTHVTAMSPSYARELQREGAGTALSAVFARNNLAGIAGGIDYATWNPAINTSLPTRYDAEDASGKFRCKGALLRELALESGSQSAEVSAPLALYVGALDSQSGADLFAAALPVLLRSTDATFVIAPATGGTQAEGPRSATLLEKMQAACERSQGRAILVQNASSAQLHRMFAAADIVLIPHRADASGVDAMRAQRYGALPVVHKTGGLSDAVVDCDGELESGTGFAFAEASQDALVGAAQRALAATKHPRFADLVHRVMRLERSWDRAARQYERLYSRG